MVSSISGFAPRAQDQSALDKELQRSQEILLASQEKAIKATDKTQVTRQQAVQGKTAGETIGKSLGTAIFGNKSLEERERLEGELQQAQQLAQAHVAQAEKKSAANKIEQETQAANDLSINRALNQYEVTGVVDDVVTNGIQSAVNSAAGRAHLTANYGDGATYGNIQVLPDPKNPTNLIVSANVLDPQGNEINGGTQNVMDLLADRGAGRIQMATDSQSLITKQNQNELAGRTLEGEVAGINAANQSKVIDASVDAATKQNRIDQSGENLNRTRQEATKFEAETGAIIGKDPEQVAVDKALADDMGIGASEILANARNARDELFALEQVATVVDTAPTGAFAETRLLASKMLKLAGVSTDIIEDTEDLEVMNNATGRAVADKIIEGGRGFTDEDRKIVQGIPASIGSSMEANKISLAMSTIFAEAQSEAANQLRSSRDTGRADKAMKLSRYSISNT